MINDWSKYPNFTKAEFDCKHTGRNDMQPAFMDALQALRTEYGHSMAITSGYRDPSHPEEARKAQPGEHSQGLASDIACGADQAYKLVALALKHGFTGIGISQRSGIPRYIHIDKRPGTPVIYCY